MRRIFMQICCGYPHRGAASNYLENLAKAFTQNGYLVILISNLNKEYSTSEESHFCFFDDVYGIDYSENEEKRKLQKEHGFAEERIGILEQLVISSQDIVFLYGIWNDYMLARLFEYRERIGFKVICGVTELYSSEDYKDDSIRQQRMKTREYFFGMSDAVLTVSNFIANFYKQRNVRVYKMPPIIDFDKDRVMRNNYSKKRILISTAKDSFEKMIRAFCSLSDIELEEIEIHICGVPLERIQEILCAESAKRLKKSLFVHKWMQYEEMLQLYEQIHFLLIARNECQRTLANFPSKVPETMAYGIVPIASEVGDYTKYYLEDGKNSIFINGDSVEEIVKSIRKAIGLSEEEYNRYSMAAMECARDRFDYRNWVDDIKAMIETV